MAAATSALPVEQSRRLERMRREPLYLLDASAVIANEGSDRDDGAVLRYHVSGSTGTLYTVSVERRRLSCTCPDFTTGARRHGVECKHCCFVVYRVLGDAFAAQHFDAARRRRIGDDQWRRLCDRTRRLHQHQHSHNGDSPATSGGSGNDEQPYDWTHDPAWRQATGLVSAADYDADATGAELQCAICFDELRAAAGSTQLLVQCGTCSKCVHRSCADQWVRTGDHDCCVYCRSPLVYAAVLAERDAHGDAARKRRRTE